LLKLLVAVQNPLYRDLDISTIETDANLKASLNGDKNQTGSLQYHLMTSISVENDQLVFDADVVAQSCDVAEVMPSSIAINGDEAPSIGTDAVIVLENSCITDIEFDGPVIDNARNEFVRAVATKLGKEVAKVEREEEAINEFDNYQTLLPANFPHLFPLGIGPCSKRGLLRSIFRNLRNLLRFQVL
jgi:hypothetical protein